MKTIAKQRPVIVATITAVAILVICGVVYRALAAYLGFSNRQPLDPIVLSPEIGDWTGKDDPIPEDIAELVKRDWDQYCNRRYRRQNEQVTLYMAYGTNVWKLIRHKVETCFVLGGWTLDDARTEELALADGTKLRCKIFHFLKGVASATVLSYYIADGQSHPDTAFWKSRIIPGAFQYVANVQIACFSNPQGPSSVRASSSARAFALDSAHAIRGAMPDARGPEADKERPQHLPSTDGS